MYNVVRRQRAMHCGDVNAALRYFNSCARADENMYWRYQVGDEQQMCDLFWSDGCSQHDYKIFGDILAFDATYGRNKYNLPVIVFSGVNHHNQTCVFGIAMVSSETQAAYVWVLGRFLECMGGKAPKAVITDGDRAMRLAIQEVFPEAHHKLCAWHLLKNATVNVCKPRFTTLLRNCMLANVEVEEFERQWDAMMDECGVWEVEFVERRYGILEFVTNFQRCVDFLRNNEEELDFRSLYGSPVLQTQFPELEKSGALNYTKEIFVRFRDALKKSVRITIVECNKLDDQTVYVTQKYRRPQFRWTVAHHFREDSFFCSCLRFESFGLPCVHILAVLVQLDIGCLPKSIVLKCWSKTAKVELEGSSPMNEEGDVNAVYKVRVGAFL
ncbi:protein FAR1-RELATED SEQUENCE 5-like [Arachis ipaensis]|uniref:protein FAR1-RELATED SEQUENCE 5-like n=1 Tax=Arachis ipaensis TaxID=130454 RepID=UPI0007AF9A65|nr:protein FAR1-RELATED SEQUENCE 5-like [Arachis ipaensis]